ncbi:MAG: tRNA (N6-isopentenyl adenosine(37)-C2)-methylthiotransferase MiaB [Halobacteriovoraceae bacterium]|nr:tRNA (N6-isopentenyl adenosine(37)-C2)-methylthiotransferase MiaB [Halobacteriovoraceae bacterium]
MENLQNNGDVKEIAGMQLPPRKVFLKTFGCQMNYHDSERIISHLSELNYSPTEDKDQADLILFNTCAIRDLANSKFYSHLGEIKHNKKNKRDLIVGVGGCVAQTEGKELVKKYEHLDFAFGTDVIDQINDMVFRTLGGESKFNVNSWDRSSNYSIETKVAHGTPQAFVNIIKGCDKFCSYCIVPFTRGREKSRKLNEVVTDIKKLVEYQGIQEVTLLGQNVNSYGKENNESLAQLIYELDKIDGLEILRYTTSHPYDVSDELIDAHGSSKKLSKHLHLPVQSGSNTVLQRMLREYTKEHYLTLLDKLRKAKSDIVISSDIIVGFPNETDQEYQETLDLLEKAQFDFIYSYVFSPRAKTKAARMEDFLSKEIKGERLRNLQKFQLSIQEKIRSQMLDKTYTVLVDGKSKMRGQEKWKGRTDCNRIIHFENNTDDNLLWNWVDLKVTSSTALSAQGEILNIHGRRLPQGYKRFR